MRYAVLCFDADGTLLDFSAAQRTALFSVLSGYGISPAEELLHRYDAINQAAWLAVERGERAKAEILVERFVTFFTHYGWSFDPMEFQAKYLAALGEDATLLPGAKELLERLYGKIPMLLFTNGTAAVQHRRLQKSGLGRYFEKVLISEELGAEKPSPLFFQRALARSGIADPKTALMIGDSITADIVGGMAAGMDTCYYNPAHLPLPAGVQPTYEIAKLAELFALSYDSNAE